MVHYSTTSSYRKYVRENGWTRSAAINCFLFLAFYFLAATGETYVDDFSNGIDTTTYWRIQRNDTLYKWDDTQEDVRFSRSPGGTLGILNTIHLIFVPVVLGDFDVKVDFSNAYINRVNGSPGNQVQLNSRSGVQVFSIVRSDEVGFGHNFHVWVDPPGQWQGYQANTDSSGTLRITRVGSTITGYFNANLIFSNVYNADVANFSFSLQNNGTTDSTSVIFDNFSVTADSIQIPTGIRDQNQKIATFELRQNFPNPFNPVTTIEFTLPQSELVKLRIYNIAGEEVTTLVSEKLTSGKHRYDWYPTDETSSGVYFYRLEAAGHTDIKKMVLLR